MSGPERVAEVSPQASFTTEVRSLPPYFISFDLGSTAAKTTIGRLDTLTPEPTDIPWQYQQTTTRKAEILNPVSQTMEEVLWVECDGEELVNIAETNINQAAAIIKRKGKVDAVAVTGYSHNIAAIYEKDGVRKSIIIRDDPSLVGTRTEKDNQILAKYANMPDQDKELVLKLDRSLPKLIALKNNPELVEAMFGKGATFAGLRFSTALGLIAERLTHKGLLTVPACDATSFAATPQMSFEDTVSMITELIEQESRGNNTLQFSLNPHQTLLNNDLTTADLRGHFTTDLYLKPPTRNTRIAPGPREVTSDGADAFFIKDIIAEVELLGSNWERGYMRIGLEELVAAEAYDSVYKREEWTEVSKQGMVYYKDTTHHLLHTTERVMGRANNLIQELMHVEKPREETYVQAYAFTQKDIERRNKLEDGTSGRFIYYSKGIDPDRGGIGAFLERNSTGAYQQVSFEDLIRRTGNSPELLDELVPAIHEGLCFTARQVKEQAGIQHNSLIGFYGGMAKNPPFKELLRHIMPYRMVDLKMPNGAIAAAYCAAKAKGLDVATPRLTLDLLEQPQSRKHWDQLYYAWCEHKPAEIPS